MFVLLIDAVFSSARTNSRKTETAADVQQKARVAADRITREFREMTITQVLGNATPGASQIVFKSARLTADNTVFGLYTRTNSALGNDSRCFLFWGGNISAPPYGGTPPSPCHTSDIPCGACMPIWQRYVGYYVVSTPHGLDELRRAVGPLSHSNSFLRVSVLTGGDSVATLLRSFEISASGGVISVSLKAKDAQVVQALVASPSRGGTVANVPTGNSLVLGKAW